MKCKDCGYYVANFVDLANCPKCNSRTIDPEYEDKKCAQCVKEGKRSKVFIWMSTSTLLYAPSYYDEDGNYVSPPDPNTHTTQYSCSNDHHWIEKT